MEIVQPKILEWSSLRTIKDNPEGIQTCPKCKTSVLIHPNYTNVGISGCVGKGKCNDLEETIIAMLKLHGYLMGKIEIVKGRNIVHFSCDKNPPHIDSIYYESLRKGGRCSKCSSETKTKSKNHKTMLIRMPCECLGFRGKHKPNICPHYNLLICFPNIAKEWNYVKNEGLIPEKIAPGSSAKYWWTCPNDWCNMSYDMPISSRTRQNQTCPFCSGSRTCEWNCLETTYPELAKEWDSENSLKPSEVTKGSQFYASWICNNCKYKWKAKVGSRTLGSGCPRCNCNGFDQMHGGHKYFLEKANRVHNNKYQYPQEYQGDTIKINIYCPAIDDNDLLHGNFFQTPADHKQGHGCPKCAPWYKQKHGGHEYFINKSNKVHNFKYLYPEQYKGNDVEINIYCSALTDGIVHGNFLQTPSIHKDGHGCPKCAPWYNQKIGGHEHFVKLANQIHKNKYQYPQEYNGNQTKIDIYCPIEGRNEIHGIFKQTPNGHKLGYGCPKCANERNESKGIKVIKKFLENLGYKENIDYFTEQTLEGLIYINSLRIDICIPIRDLAIEYDGALHFNVPKDWGGKEKLDDNKLRDLAKDRFCIEKGLNLLRIPYTFPLTIEFLGEMLELCKSGKQLYVSYSEYYEEIKKKVDLSKVHYIRMKI